MNLQTLIACCATDGIRVTIDGNGNLRAAPPRSVTRPVAEALRAHKRELLALPRVALCGRDYPVVVDAAGAAFVLCPPTLREVVEYEGQRRRYPAVGPVAACEESWRVFAASGDDAELMQVLDALPGGVP